MRKKQDIDTWREYISYLICDRFGHSSNLYVKYEGSPPRCGRCKIPVMASIAQHYDRWLSGAICTWHTWVLVKRRDDYPDSRNGFCCKDCGYWLKGAI